MIPYTYVYRAYAKKRWYGRTITDVFQSEFVAFTKEYYVSYLERERQYCVQGLLAIVLCIVSMLCARALL